jgi:hypothetical protein
MTSIKNKLTLCGLLAMGLAGRTQAQTLLYQWNFDNNPTATTSIADVSAGGGNLTVTTSSGSGSDMTFNSSAGPGIAGANGAMTVSGGGYSSGNTSVALATDLSGLGTLSQISVGLWFNLGSSVAGQLPRFVEIGSSDSFDSGGHGGNDSNGIGASVNGWATGPAFPASSVQNGIDAAVGNSTTDNPQFAGANLAVNTWYYELITYDGTSTANNFSTYLGSSPTTLTLLATDTENLGSIAFGNTASVSIGNIGAPADERALSSGQVADVEVWTGIEPAPEPTTIALAGLGGVTMLVAARRRRN